MTTAHKKTNYWKSYTQLRWERRYEQFLFSLQIGIMLAALIDIIVYLILTPIVGLSNKLAWLWLYIKYCVVQGCDFMDIDVSPFKCSALITDCSTTEYIQTAKDGGISTIFHSVQIANSIGTCVAIIIAIATWKFVQRREEKAMARMVKEQSDMIESGG